MPDTSRLDTASLLAQLPLFTDIGDAALERLARAAQSRSLERGSLIFRQGHPCTGFYVVVSGQVKLFALSPTGQEKVIELIGPGQSFAEAFMFLGWPCRVNAQALLACTLISLSRESVMAEVAADGQFALRMLAGLSRRLHGLVHDVQSAALQSGLQRVIGYLLGESREDKPDQAMPDGHSTVALPATKATIASRLSVTPEYLSRVLRELEEAGLVVVDKRTIHIPDRQRLIAYGA